MSTPAHDLPEPPDDSPAPAPPSPTRPLYWSVRRELWENRSIYIAPLAAAGLMLFGFSIRAISLPQRIRGLSALDPAKQHAVVVMPFSIVATLILMTSVLVALYYCLDALHGERRDRSILFWKSLPVSDLTTVLSKASIPLVVLPAVGFTISLATQLVLLALHTAILQGSGVGAAALWSRLPFVQMALIMLYGVIVHALWHAPIYGWLLLVSGWARRATFLWAVLPPLALGVFERIVFQTSHFGKLMAYRVIGAMKVAFIVDGNKDADIVRLSQLDPVRFLSTPGLWLGLIAAAAFLAAAVRLRRFREPI